MWMTVIFGPIIILCLLGTTIKKTISRTIIELSHDLIKARTLNKSEFLLFTSLVKHNFSITIGKMFNIDMKLFVMVDSLQITT